MNRIEGRFRRTPRSRMPNDAVDGQALRTKTSFRLIKVTCRQECLS